MSQPKPHPAARPSRPNKACVSAALAVAMLLATLGRHPAEASDATREGRLTDLVRQDCGSCHGMTLKGGLGRPLLPDDLAHIEAGAIAEIILHGIPGTPMPPWRGALTPEDAQWIAEKLKKGFPQ